MSCQRCGCEYMQIKKHELECPKCGHIQGKPMIDDAELMEMFETEIDRIIMVGKKQGLNYPKILYCILHRLENMVMQCSAEAWLEHKE